MYAISEDDIEQFYREGYFLAPSFIDQACVDALNAEREEHVKGIDSKEWSATAVSNLDEAATELPATVAFLRDPRLVQIYEALLGAPVKLWLGMYAVVMPGGDGLAWHQDNQYTHILGHMLNAFVALDEISVEKAGLWIAPGSHRLGRQPNINTEPGHRRAADPENGEPCPPMKPGDAMIFHRETLHRSLSNRTDTPRRAFAFQVASGTCRYAETGKLLEDRHWLSKTQEGE